MNSQASAECPSVDGLAKRWRPRLTLVADTGPKSVTGDSELRDVAPISQVSQMRKWHIRCELALIQGLPVRARGWQMKKQLYTTLSRSGSLEKSCSIQETLKTSIKTNEIIKLPFH